MKTPILITLLTLLLTSCSPKISNYKYAIVSKIIPMENQYQILSDLPTGEELLSFQPEIDFKVNDTVAIKVINMPYRCDVRLRIYK